jgi:RNA polymerase sigma-70 factor (ECF subfamily)
VAVQQAIKAVQARYPEVKWDPASLEALDTPHLDDLFIARAAVAHDEAAIAILEREVLPSLRGALLRIRPDDAFVDEALQEIRQRLLVGPSPRLGVYSGKGPLKAWARAFATGTGLDLVRKQRPNDAELDEDAQAIEVNAAGAGADIALLKARHGKQFSAALKGAMAALTPHERTVLRMRFIDGLTREEIGAFFKVHRTTALRWLEKAQATLLTKTRETLAAQLSLSAEELDSLIQYLQSGVGQSLVAVLRE